MKLIDHSSKTKYLLFITGFFAIVLFIYGNWLNFRLGYDAYLRNKYNMDYSVGNGTCYDVQLRINVATRDDPHCAELQKSNLGFAMIGLVILQVFAEIAFGLLGVINLVAGYFQLKATKNASFLKWSGIFLILGFIPYLINLIIWLILKKM